jgi:hypothetical protein
VKVQWASCASSAHTWDQDMYDIRWVHAQNIHSWQVTWLISEANTYTDLTVDFPILVLNWIPQTE